MGAEGEIVQLDKAQRYAMNELADHIELLQQVFHAHFRQLANQIDPASAGMLDKEFSVEISTRSAIVPNQHIRELQGLMQRTQASLTDLHDWLRECDS